MSIDSGVAAAFGAALLYNLATVVQKSQAQREFAGMATAMGGVVLLLRTAGAPTMLLPETAGGLATTVVAAITLITAIRFLSARSASRGLSAAAVLLGLSVGLAQGMSDTLNRRRTKTRPAQG